MWNVICLVIFTLTVAACTNTTFAEDQPVRKFCVRDYGTLANSEADAGPGIRQAIADAVACKSPAEVVLEAGRYLIKPMENSTYCISIDNASDITIRGQHDKTEIIIVDPRGTFLYASTCQNVTVKDLKIDYDPLPFTQGRVAAIDTAAGTFDLDIDEGFPLLSEPYFEVPAKTKFGLIMDSKKRQLKAVAADHVFMQGVEHVSDRIWRLTLVPDQRAKLIDMAIGDRFVQLARQGSGAISFVGSSNCKAENVTVYASPSLAFAVIASEDRITIRNCSVRVKPDSSRLLSTNADGVHCQRNRIGPIIENCYFEGMADDSINIYTPPCVVREVRSTTELVTSKGGGVRPGDTLQILEPATGRVRCEVKAENVQEQSGGYLLTLEKPVEGVKAGKDHREADTIYNLSGCGAGFIIRNNTMRNHRRHGILLRAGDGVVEGNTIDEVSGFGIVLTNAPGWPEGPMPWNIAVRNNIIKGCGYSRDYGQSPVGAAIQVRGIGLNVLSSDRPIHGITISDNRIINSPVAAIYIGAARNVQISSNVIEASPEIISRRQDASIIVDDCERVSIKDNKVTDTRPQTTAAVRISPSTARGSKDVHIQNLQSQLAPGHPEVIDKREIISD